MSHLSLNPVTINAEEQTIAPEENHDAIQGQPSTRRSSPNTPMLEVRYHPESLQQNVYRASSMIQRLSSGTRILSPSDIPVSLTPHQQAALGISTSLTPPEVEVMIQTAIPSFEELSQQCKESN